MIALVPYQTDAARHRFPGANWALIGITLIIHLAIELGRGYPPPEYILGHGGAVAIVGYMFLHIGWVHLIGNLLFLFVFGNAVCSRIGNIAYLVCYLVLGAGAGLVHLLFDGAPAVGASGAINGVVGMYLCFFPRARISVFWLLLYRVGVFRVQGFWMIGLWVALDLLGAIFASGGVAYFAHLGGMGLGLLLGFFFLYTGLARFHQAERPLFSFRRTEDESPAPGPQPETASTAAQTPVPAGETADAIPVEPAPQPASDPRPTRATPPPLPASRRPALAPSAPMDGQVRFEPTGEGGVRITCSCGREFVRDARWRHTKTVCPACFATIEPPES